MYRVKTVAKLVRVSVANLMQMLYMGHDNQIILLQFQILLLFEEDDTTIDVQNSADEYASWKKKLKR